jgi:hypothetical protein
MTWSTAKHRPILGVPTPEIVYRCGSKMIGETFTPSQSCTGRCIATLIKNQGLADDMELRLHDRQELLNLALEFFACDRLDIE